MSKIDKYGSKHRGSQTNKQANIRGMYGQKRTYGVYILDVKIEYIYMRRKNRVYIR